MIMETTNDTAEIFQDIDIVNIENMEVCISEQLHIWGAYISKYYT
jgi:hypothetical protein